MVVWVRSSNPRGHGSAAVSSTSTCAVVLATHNGSRYLSEQLASLASQTRAPDEVVVVDDASTDDTVARLEHFAASAPFPVRLHPLPEHVGTCRAFETGFRSTSSDIVLICDQDDRWVPEKVEVMVHRMDLEPQAPMAFSDATLIDAEGRTISRSRWRVAGFSGRRSWTLDQDPLGFLLGRQLVSGCTTALRRSLLDLVLPFPENLHTALPDMMYDRWISLVSAATGPVIAVPERLVEYRIHADQQVGIPGLAIRRVAPRAALAAGQFVPNRTERAGRAEYHRQHLREIDKRISAQGLDHGWSPLAIRLADQHLQSRSQLPRRRSARIRPVGREYLSEDGYRRFAIGIPTAVSDLIR